MVTIDNLPDEVLLRILSYVQSMRDLAALAIQCRSFHRVCDMATRRQYRRIRLRSPGDLQLGFAMLLSILRRPRLGIYVRHIEINRPPLKRRSYEKGTHDVTMSLDEDDLERLRVAIRRAGFRGEEEDTVMNMLLQKQQADEPRRR